MIDIFKLQEDKAVNLIRLQLKANIQNGFNQFFMNSCHSCMNFFNDLSRKHPEFALIMQIGDEYKAISLIHDPNLFADILRNAEVIKQSSLYSDLCKYVATQVNQAGEVPTKLMMCRLVGKVRPPKTPSNIAFVAKYMLYFKRIQLRTSALAYMQESNPYVLMDKTTNACLPFDIFTRDVNVTQTYHVYDPLFSVDRDLDEMAQRSMKGEN